MGARGKEAHRQDGVVAWGGLEGGKQPGAGLRSTRWMHGLDMGWGRRQEGRGSRSRAFMRWGGYLAQRKVIEVGSWQGLTGFLSSPLSWGL